jgi:arylsulfatase A-like enzyme
VALASFAVLGAASAPGRQAEAAARPNVLFIVIDDLNDWVGCLGGNPQARTPNIDRLAERGVLFTNAHAPAPACNPCRSAVMTGIAPHRSGLYDQRPGFRSVLPGALTLPQRLHAAGYATLGSGKVFHHAFPDPQSWQSYFPSKESAIPADVAKRKLEPILGNLYGAEVDAPASELGDGIVADWIAATLARPPDQPFFLACGFYRPHTPWTAPAESFARFPLDEIELPAAPADDLDDVPAAGRELARAVESASGDARRAVRAYLACTSFVDDQVGRVIAALDASPRAQDTIVVLWSDNGFHLGEKQAWSKQTLWEESTRVPLIVVTPGRAGERRCARPVSLQDLTPTILELCGVERPESMDGRSLVPLLEDPLAAWDPPALSTSGFGNHALRSERWRYIRYADGSEELYDHSVDPGELRNLAADPDLATVKAELARWLPTEEAPSQRRR